MVNVPPKCCLVLCNNVSILSSQGVGYLLPLDNITVFSLYKFDLKLLVIIARVADYARPRVKQSPAVKELAMFKHILEILHQ